MDLIHHKVFFLKIITIIMFQKQIYLFFNQIIFFQIVMLPYNLEFLNINFLLILNFI